MNLKRSLALAISVLMILTALPVAFGAGETLDRIAGGNRWATAVEISQEGWATAGTVVLANGRNYPDALAGVSLAYGLDAPILLTEADSLVAETKAEITRLGAAKVVILGGTGVISAAVATEIEGMGLTVERISGADRFATAAAVAMKVAPAGSATVVLASGRGYADALAAGSYAAINGYPILLTEKNSLPDATKKAIEDLGATNIIVVGGTGVVADSALTGLNFTRVAGSNREATSVELAEHFNLQTNMYFLATGDGFADAITGAVLAAKEGTGILLVRGSLATVTTEFFANAQVVDATIFGGTGAISEALATAAAAKLVPAGGTGVAGKITNGGKATITIGNVTGTATDDGSYRIIGVAPGAHTMTVTKDDHPTKQVPVNVVKDNVSVCNFDLGTLTVANIGIKGAVIDKATGLSLDATVTLDVWNVDDAKWDVNVGTAIIPVAGSGVFQYTNAASAVDFGDKVRVNVVMDGYHSATRTITLAKYSEANVLDGFELTAINEMTLSGKVTSGTTNISGATVSLLDKDGKALTPPLSTTTDADGLYTFGDQILESGTYTLKVEAATYATSSVLISISEGVDKAQNVVLAPGYTVTFTLAPNGTLGAAFIAGDMTATLVKNNVTIDDVEVLGASGATVSFAFPDNSIAPGTYTLKIAGEYVKTTNFAITVVDKAVVAYGSADFAGSVAGTVTKASDSSVIEGAKVELINKSGVVVATTTTGAAGDYAFANLVTGDYKIKVTAEGFIANTSPAAFTVTVNVATPAQDFALDANPISGQIGGTIRTAGTLLPATGATITYYALNVTGVDAGDVVKFDTVASDGTYAIIDLAPGSYTVVIRHEGSHETLVTTQSIVAGDDIDKNFLLNAGGTASLAIKLTNHLDAVVGTATVEVFDANHDAVALEGYTAAFDGTDTYELANLSAGTYTITITDGSYLPMEIPVTITKGTDVTRAFELTPVGGSLAVTVGVRGIDHLPLDGVEVVAFDADGKKVDLAIPATVGGESSFNLKAGTYTLGFSLNGYLYAETTVTVGTDPVTVPAVVLIEW